jgi:UDP-N-acetylmuramate dehydrogenase
LTSFKIGGTASEFYAPGDLESFRNILRDLRLLGKTPFLLGGGANVLFPDGEYPRPVIFTGSLRGLEISGNTIRAECGVRLNTLLRAALERGLAGLEGLVGIPGSAGGAVMMNAGGGGFSFGDRVKELGLLPIDGGPLVRLKGNEVCWSYRDANVRGYAVAWVLLELRPANLAKLKFRVQDLMRRKRETQPLSFPSAGCVFRNPEGASAGKLIEALGLKGMQQGGARVSERHANFIVNANGSARAQDVVSLLKEVRDRVERSFGVRLETEIVLA